MASALMNMMMDDEKKKAATNAPSTPAQPPTQPPAPQMPVSPAAVTPAQQGTGGAGPQPPTQGASTQDAARALMNLLKGGRGPVNPKTQAPLPAYDWRSEQGGSMPAYTEYEGKYEVDPITQNRTFVPTLDAQGNKIVKTKGRDLVLEETTAQTGVEPTEDAQTRIKDIRPTGQGAGPSPRTSADDLMAGARADADLQAAYQAGEITQQDLNRDLGASNRANFGQGMTSIAPKTMSDSEARFQEVGKLKIMEDPLAMGPRNIASTKQVDQRIRETIRKGSGSNNPFTLMQATKSQLDREVSLLRQRGANLQKATIGEIAALGIDVTNTPEFQKIAAQSYGKPLDTVLAEYQRTYGKPLLSAKNVQILRDATSKAAEKFLGDAQAITQSTGYKILDTTLKSKDTLQLNSSASERLAKAGLGYLTAIGRSDEIDIDTARSYFNMAISGDPTMEMYRDGIESQLADDPDFGFMFKRGAEGTISKSVQSMQGLNGALAEVVKHSLDSVSDDLVRGATGNRTARQGTVRLMNRFIMPFYDAMQSGSVSGFQALQNTPWGRAFARPLQQAMSVTDTQNLFKQIIDTAGAPDDPSRKPLMDSISAPFGVKRALKELFTFDTQGREAEFDAMMPDLESALDAGESRRAAQLLAPFSSTDQLQTLFGVSETTGIDGQGRDRNVLPLAIEDITGAGGSRRQAIDSYLSQRGAFNRAADKFDSTELKMRGPQLVARLAGQFKADPTTIGITTRDAQNNFQIGFVAEAGDEQKIQTVLSDIEKYLRPSVTNGPDKKAVDPLFDETLNSVNDTISKLRFNLDNNRLPTEKIAGSTELLKALEDVRDRALGDLDDVVKAGAGRHLLFRMTEDGPDYSAPIRTSGSASKVAQLTDMLYASVTNTPGVNINRYFKGAADVAATKINSVLVVPVDTRGRPVPNMSPVAVKPDEKGNVRVPVFEMVDGKYKRATDPFGNNRFTVQAQSSGEQARAGLIQRAANDAGRGNNVDASYVRSQVHEFTRHLERIVLPEAAGSEERRLWLWEHTGIIPDERGRITNSSVEMFLQKANKVEQRDLLTFVDMYGESELLRPNPRVGWTMNASNSRGQSAGTEGAAISGIEREAGRTATDDARTRMFTLATTAKQTIRNMASEYMDAGIGVENDQQRAVAHDRVMKGLISSIPELGANNAETAVMRDNLRDYIDAVLNDDTAAQTEASKKISKTIGSYTPSQEAIDTQVRELVKSPELNIARPLNQAEQLTTEEVIARARDKSAEEGKARRAKQRYFHTAFFPDLGWIYADGPLDVVNQFKALEAKAKSQGSVKNINFDRVKSGLTTMRKADSRDVRATTGQRVAAGGEKINQKPAPVGAKKTTVAVPQAEPRKIPFAGLYQPDSKPKTKFGPGRSMGIISGAGVVGSAMGGMKR